MRPTEYLLFLMNDAGDKYLRVGNSAFDSVAQASTAGFLAHIKQGGGNRPYLVLPGSRMTALDSLDSDFVRSEADLHAAVALDGSAILSVQELRTYLLNHRPDLDTPRHDYVLYAQSYGADNCHEPHETRYGCDCWVGMTDEDTEMLLEEVSENTSTYPAFKLVARQSTAALNSQNENMDTNMPSALASAMARLNRVIAAGELKGARLPKPEISFLQDVLTDLEITAAMYED